MINDLLKGPLLRIERANEHINEFKLIHDAFLTDHPIRLFTEPYGDGRHKIVKLRLTKMLPDRASILVGDICGSLRSALDQLAVALPRKNAGSSNSGIYFPIAGSIEEFESPSTQAKISKLTPDAIDLLKSLKPYRGGNDDLWSLSKLRVTDFHHNLIGVAADCLPMIQNSHGLRSWKREDDGEIFRFGGFPWDIVNNGMDVAITANDIKLENEVSVALGVVFREPETLNGIPVLPHLYRFSRLVEHITLSFRERFFT